MVLCTHLLSVLFVLRRSTVRYLSILQTVTVFVACKFVVYDFCNSFVIISLETTHRSHYTILKSVIFATSFLGLVRFPVD